ncbi:hypothetical protein PVAP13_4KG184633 [Panicum virgatum]|uniref:Uncharacterized protein n=1 Tax=Panicum virgatum TaxID=38727 RepID=A0A8T0TNA5_PANVG|nr:hypothetical protein PVAP13_4KG184633 [Panicum virgatum]
MWSGARTEVGAACRSRAACSSDGVAPTPRLGPRARPRGRAASSLEQGRVLQGASGQDPALVCDNYWDFPMVAGKASCTGLGPRVRSCSGATLTPGKKRPRRDERKLVFFHNK